MSIEPAVFRRPPRQRHAASETGTTMIEVVVTAALLLVVALGVLKSFDNANGQTKTTRGRAIAGNIAQTEQERLRALPLTELSNTASTSTSTSRGMTFDVNSRAEWVTDSSGEASCATGGATADYLHIETIVSGAGLNGAKPVTMDSIVAPSARAFDANQGALAVKVVRANGDPVPGLLLRLDGPKNVTGVTNDLGCVLWGYLPASNAYTMSYGVTGWVDPTGVTSVSKSVTVVGEQTRNEVASYDEGGRLSARFTVDPVSKPSVADKPTYPLVASVVNPGPPSTMLPYAMGATENVLTSPLSFPFTSDYAVYADRCASAKPSDARGYGLAKVTAAGMTTTTSNGNVDHIHLPSLDYKFVNTGSGSSTPSVKVVVTTPCGTKYTRTSNSNGRLDDTGFPWGTLAVCASSTTTNTRRTWSVTNSSLPGVDQTYDMASSAGATPLSSTVLACS